MLLSNEKKFMDFIHGRSGSFYTHLFKAIMVADSHNIEKLRKGFPECVSVVEHWRFVPGYANNLEVEYNVKKEINDEGSGADEASGIEGKTQEG